MYKRSRLTVAGKTAICQASAWHERSSKPTFLDLAERSATAAASPSRVFTELPSAFCWQLGEISANPLFVRLANPGDLLKAHWVRPAGLRAKPAYSEGCR